MDLNKIKSVQGHQLRLRLVQPDDAAYIYDLRMNPDYNSHLSTVTGTVTDQEQWIRTYKAREAMGDELYYIIERLDGTRCGVVRLYEMTAQTFTWGSFILDKNKPAKAAYDAAILSFGIGFQGLNKEKALIDARLGNTHAIAFYHRFGMIETHQDAENVYFEYEKNTFFSQHRCDVFKIGNT